MGTLDHSVNPETIYQNKNRANLSPLDIGFERAWANRGNRLKQCCDFAREYNKYKALDDETKAEVDREMSAEENEILEQEREAILADWWRYYPNQFAPERFIHRVYTAGRLSTGSYSFSFIYFYPPSYIRKMSTALLVHHGGFWSPWSTLVLPGPPWSTFLSDEEAGNGLEDSDEVYGEEMIYKEEKEEEETDNDNGGNENDDDYHNDKEQEGSSHSLSQSENSDVDMIGAGEISGSSLGRASRDLDHSHSVSSTGELYSDAVENHFRTATQEIGERLLGRAMTPKDFFTSPEDQQDRIEHIITKRKEDAKEQGIDLEEMDRIDREMDRQALLNLSRQQFPHPVKKKSEK
ncbi:hypothetical protein B9Z19DRAFT_1127870 [Tuber borchii]|uniref:Uncharacterized protein n=1 Tax=Tuber borchii TaxID=42251 RepID=A0A2T6ZQM5_TUBBO|nr:hypothetical protein B9Z19DRAFT_1127870 [Tuber borchii]